jgi:heme A synthase
MLDLHLVLTRAIVLYLAVCAIWGVGLIVRRRPVGPSYRATLLIAEGLFVVQDLLGLAVLAGGKAPHDVLHYLYGILGVASLPIVLGFLERGKHRENLWLGLLSVFLLGIAIRAWMTGATG